ncbi:protein of unknown function DUF433 [Halothece sp. PCC 7418]|uniref:DUF433 domain-containing protein n=1 Tax=Halothece sp. (strain PCC 7418) TaxID=65093 RepID=UPI0002A067F8|nr:DUF433 domain-containing protein [Halothece sp. PCC 7418]AFZ42825.1 protein of unknown function DUF433 [Halothece sp. PCC 7418]
MSQAVVNIGSLITTSPDLQSGRPIIAGTGTSVRRIVTLYKQGDSADKIVADKPYLTLAQVHAALAYYYANQQIIDQDLEAEATEYERLASQLS